MDKITIRLKDIELTQLNNESLRLVGTYVRLVKSKKAKTMKMQDKDILVQISNYTRQENDAELNELYGNLKQGILESIHQSLIKKS